MEGPFGRPSGSFVSMDANTRHHNETRLNHVVARHRDARQTLYAPASPQSRYGLDWMNFFLADVQTGFGTFVAFYLARLGWSERSVGLALTLGGIARKLGAIFSKKANWEVHVVSNGLLTTGQNPH
jgi:hypothetical protein